MLVFGINGSTINTDLSTDFLWLHSEGLDGLCTARGTQEPWEGVFGHQTIDPLLGLIEGVGTQRVHHAQQSLAGLSIQVYLIGERWGTDLDDTPLNPVMIPVVPHCLYLCCFHITPCAHLLWGVGVDELAVDAAGFGLWRRHPVVLTGQPELEILLAELGAQEPPKGLQAALGRVKERCGRKEVTGSVKGHEPKKSTSSFTFFVHWTEQGPIKCHFEATLQCLKTLPFRLGMSVMFWAA